MRKIIVNSTPLIALAKANTGISPFESSVVS